MLARPEEARALLDIFRSLFSGGADIPRIPFHTRAHLRWIHATSDPRRPSLERFFLGVAARSLWIISPRPLKCVIARRRALSLVIRIRRRKMVIPISCSILVYCV